MPTRSYQLSRVAEFDMDELYRNGIHNWGVAQADAYYDALLEHFNLLCENPFMFQTVEDIRAGHRRSVCKAHAIYYRVFDTYVEIMAVVKHQDFGG